MTGRTLTALAPVPSSWLALRSCSDDDLIAEVQRRCPTNSLALPVLFVHAGEHRLYLHVKEEVASWDGTLFGLSFQQTEILSYLMHLFPLPAPFRDLTDFCRPDRNLNRARQSLHTDRLHLNRLMPEIITTIGTGVQSRWHLTLCPVDWDTELLVGQKRVEKETPLGTAQYLRKVSR